MKHVCSCGEAEPHVIARRTTADGFMVHVWSDGWLTNRLSERIAKLPATHAFQRKELWTALDLVSLVDWAELKTLAREWRRARGLTGATEATARVEVLRRMAPPKRTPVDRVLDAAHAVYREVVTAAGVRVLLRIR